jgi:hypothetical protein
VRGAADGFHTLDHLFEDTLDELGFSVQAVGGHAGADQTGGQVATEIAEALDQRRARAVAGSTDGGGDPAWASPDDQHVAGVDNGNFLLVMHRCSHGRFTLLVWW